MVSRSPHERHRVSTNLELLFDLTFVVAVSQAAAQLSTHLERDEIGGSLLGYVMVFFAIWWAWLNFTWFASAYDTDDVPYRLLTLLQMAGVLILAAGVPAAFDDRDFAYVTVGYAVMRVALIAQWIRAWRSDPERGGTARRFAIGVGLVQVGWLLRLLLPEEVGVVTFFALVLAELAVPVWAEGAGSTSWHPQHIVERYGLFTIIVLGESVLAATVAVQAGLSANGLTVELALVGLIGLVLLFVLWWLYFLVPMSLDVGGTDRRSFTFGYLHYFVFASLAAVGAGIEVTVAATVHGGSDHPTAAPLTVAYAVAVPVAAFLASLWLLHVGVEEDRRLPGPAVLATVAATLLLGLVALTGAGTVLTMAAVLLAPLLLLLFGLVKCPEPADDDRDADDRGTDDRETNDRETGRPGAGRPDGARA